MSVKPPSQYFGGKQEFIDFYLDHMPTKGIRTGVEVCGGMASWTLARKPFANDVINDAYEFISDLFQGIRDHPKKLATGLSATPYSYTEWKRCRIALSAIESRRRAGNQPTQPTHEIARMFLTVLRQSLATAPGQAWSRVIDHSRRDMCSSCSRWIDAPDGIQAISDRLRTVQIESLDWTQCIKKYDRKTTLFFVDPPYLESVRKTKANTYMKEFTKEDHIRLISALRAVQGKVMLCGYANKMYDSALKNWDRHVYKVHARTNIKNDGSKSKSSHREEVLWIKS